MGGYGALRLGLRFPNLFGAISAVAPSILRDMGEEPRYRTYCTFDDDRDYYEEVGPWNLTKFNAKILNKEKTRLRILAGERDSRLLPTLHEYHEWLKRLDIAHALIIVEGAEHAYQDILEGYGQNAFTFWIDAFGDLQ